MMHKYHVNIFLALFLSIIWSGFNSVLAQAPNIRYPTPPSSYPLNTTITPLAPANSGGAVPANIYGEVTTFVGGRAPVSYDSNGTDAGFNLPSGITADGAGNLYVSDYGSGAIRKVTPAATVTTIANVRTPSALILDQQGDIVVTDFQDNYLYKINTSYSTSIYAGTGSAGVNNGTITTAMFNNPGGMAIDATGNIYVADQQNNKIRKITPTGLVTTFAGSGSAGATDNTGLAASFNNPDGLAIDKQGNLYVTDTKNNLIRKITPAGVVTTFAGSGATGNSDGLGRAASFNYPTSVAIDASGNLYVTDYKSNLIRKIAPNGMVTTLAGNATVAKIDGVGKSASFYGPLGAVVSISGDLFITDEVNYVIRKISITGYTIDKPLPSGLTFDPTTGTISGTPTATSPAIQYTITAYNASGSSSTTITLAVGQAAPSAPVVTAPNITYTTPQNYIVNTAIAPLAPTNTGGAVPATIYGQVSTLAGSGSLGYSNGTGAGARFNIPYTMAGDAAGNLYVADASNNAIRKVTPTGVVTTFAGSNVNGNTGAFINGVGTAARFNNPQGIAVDASGNFFVGDYGNNAIREITPAGVVSTFYQAPGAFGPTGVCFDNSGNLIVSAQDANQICSISPAGVLTIIAGSPATYVGYTNATGTAARFNLPEDVQVDASGNIYVADYLNNAARMISPAGVVTTFAGSNVLGNTGSFADGVGTAARFNNLTGVALGSGDVIYVADLLNNDIRRIMPDGTVSLVAGSASQAQGSANGTGTAASFFHPVDLYIDHSATGYIADARNGMIRKIVLTGYTIDKPLPPGLTFNVTTGIITGTPTTLSPPTQYTVTAYNGGGFSQFTITISVIIPLPVITYPTPEVYIVDTPITPLLPTNTGGTATNYTVDQPLPAGLTLDPAMGIISGTPTVPSPATDYKVTATNSSGSGSFTINITVIAKALTPQTITFNPIPTKTYGDTDFDPGALSTNNAIPIVYTSDNTGVATIVNGDIHITGAGTANITASQAGNTIFTAAAPITEELTVNKALLTITVKDETRVYGIPNPEFTITYTGFVYGETKVQLIAPAIATTTATEASPPGEYPINISGEMSNNYAFNPIPGTLTITAVSPTIVIPNAFTPNGDGYNDLWDIPTLAGYPQCMVSIYNRYGGLIYQSRGYPRAWDGTYHGSQLPTGTYYYIIDLKNGTPPLSGYVAVIR